uniref:Reverse transcriptase domain-containing protein n=1 Tax=Micrurus spixii TaxID=129469 RepID=A0A2D4LJG9_9SAUR
MLNEKIRLEEVNWAINKQKNDKAPGPDGLPAELYKAQQDILSTKMFIIFNEVLDEAKIPQSWNDATITVIPKEGNDQTNIRNYRPISLLNVDYKTFVTIIEDRLKNF